MHGIKALALLACVVALVELVSCATHVGFVSSLPNLSPSTRNAKGQIIRLRPSVSPVKMSLKDSSVKAIKTFASRISQSAVLLASLSIALCSPQRASAKASQYGISSDGNLYNYAPKQTSSAPIGAAVGLTALTFGGMCAVAIKKEKSVVAQDQDIIDKELDRLVQFKQEFLDGVPSDRSIYASLAKAMSKDSAPKPAKEEDEFEKNVRAYLEEEEEKNKKKKGEKKPDGVGKGPSSALLERPSDPDGSKADAWMSDIEIDDKPASIADEDLKRLQRMFGGDLPKL